MPDDYSSILPAHTDCISGDSAFQLVVWIPLTDCFNTNSMFIGSPESSLESLNDIRDGIFDEKGTVVNFLSILIKKEYLIFPPTLIHGTHNTTNSTRVSLNLVKSLFAIPFWTQMIGAWVPIIKSLI